VIVIREARHHFGTSADPSLEEIGRIAGHDLVFRTGEDGDPPAATATPPTQPRLRP
jgi:hypothetical protein